VLRQLLHVVPGEGCQVHQQVITAAQCLHTAQAGLIRDHVWAEQFVRQVYMRLSTSFEQTPGIRVRTLLLWHGSCRSLESALSFDMAW